ncbi:Diphthamide biosynthesis protein 2 [Phlyctochytrium bullatum]|nr:Diphthamide biosynthesis protein 2 [Phlyctochytrium bullatum]
MKKIIIMAGKKPYVIAVGKPNVAKLGNFLEIDVFVLVACPENSLLDSKEFLKPIITPYELDAALNRPDDWFTSYKLDLNEACETIEASIPENYTPPGGDLEVAIKSSGALAALENSLAATFLTETRTYKGLEVRAGETSVKKASEGRSGVASQYQGTDLIETSEYLTEKGGNRIKRVVFPNIIYRFVYSRLLDMNIFCRLTTTTLRQIERKGGFDEYVLSIGDKRCDNDQARMYKKLVEEAFSKNKDSIREEEVSLAAKHGGDYAKAKTNERIEQMELWIIPTLERGRTCVADRSNSLEWNGTEREEVWVPKFFSKAKLVLFEVMDRDDEPAFTPFEEDLLRQATNDNGLAPTSSSVLQSIANDLENAPTPKLSIRRQYAKIDAERLASPDGLPALFEQVKDFQFRGKGHELEDLRRLMEVYQIWGHELFPSLAFRPLILTSEKVCRQNRMKVWLEDLYKMNQHAPDGAAAANADEDSS